MDKKKRLGIIFGILVLIFATSAALRYFEKKRIPEMDSGLVSISKDFIFGVSLDLSGKGKSSIDADSAAKEIEAVSALGAGLVRLNISGKSLEDPEEIKKLKQLKDLAVLKRMKVCWSLLASEANNFEILKKDYSDDIVVLAGELSPDYVVILPDYSPDSAGTGSVQYMNFAKELALSVKRKSFETKVILEGDFDPANSEADFLGRVMEDNDPIFDIISMKAEDAGDLEEGRKKLSEKADKYHWHGGIWMGCVRHQAGGTAIEQKDFFLYSIHLANSNGFEGLIIADLRDKQGRDGIMTEDFRPKYSYEAIRKTMGQKKQ